MGFSRQEYWSGLPLPSPGDLSDSGIEPRSPALEADALTYTRLKLTLGGEVTVLAHFLKARQHLLHIISPFLST